MIFQNHRRVVVSPLAFRVKITASGLLEGFLSLVSNFIEASEKLTKTNYSKTKPSAQRQKVLI
jgi:hypothetical protein